VLLFLALLLLILLESPWNVVAFAVCLVLFVGEALLWYRTVKGRRVAAGAETLVGVEGQVVTRCRPEGQVRLRGEVWAARCDGGADEGETVRVVGRRGLVLLVEPVR
jgi:membrane-bound serine protease (ClpP class)